MSLQVALRILTSQIASSAAYLAGQGLATKYTAGGASEAGGSYDPADATFHSRYLALLQALSGTGLCQNDTVVMMYAGYASASYGDE